MNFWRLQAALLIPGIILGLLAAVIYGWQFGLWSGVGMLAMLVVFFQVFGVCLQAMGWVFERLDR